jgi:hypothetical protein
LEQWAADGCDFVDLPRPHGRRSGLDLIDSRTFQSACDGNYRCDDLVAPLLNFKR